jgi:hypothetical protein
MMHITNRYSNGIKLAAENLSYLPTLKSCRVARSFCFLSRVSYSLDGTAAQEAALLTFISSHSSYFLNYFH